MQNACRHGAELPKCWKIGEESTEGGSGGKCRRGVPVVGEARRHDSLRAHRQRMQQALGAAASAHRSELRLRTLSV
eukprot:842581-Pleurochrysis_carterae.AAC.3